MTISQMTIKKNSEDNYEFFYHKYPNGHVRPLDQERVEIVRFIDDSVDVILRLKNKMTTFPAGKYQNPSRVLFEAGNDLSKDVNLEVEEC